MPVYPAPALLVTVPLALLPYRLAALLFTAGAVVATCGGLRLLGVRDWRCYGAAFLSYSMLNSLRLGQLTGYLILGIAIAWRWRRDVVISAAAVAAVIALKLFLWPLGAFLLMTKRWRTVFLAAALIVVAGLLAWAVIGFDGLGAYPRMVNDVSVVEGAAGVSYVSVGLALGVSRTIAEAGSLVITAALLGMAVMLLWRPDGERRAFGLVIVASLASSPVVWPHYLALLFVPIALVSPTLSPLWLVPLLGYLSPFDLTHGEILRMLPYVAIEIITIAALYAWPVPGRGSGRTAESRLAGSSGLVLAAPAQPGGRCSG